ncbi:MAG TPA: heparinase II/III family protein [Opitutaceae bacterium]|nr:heparinase II/III family protein [Opitutaceae bacterium]
MRSLVLVVCGGLASAAFGAFPKPHPERAFPELKVYDASGRPWRVAREDWAGARQHVASDPGWAAWLQRERTTVDAWMAKHRDHLEWAAGWSHDGVSPKDGSRVIWTDQIPRAEVSYFASRSDPRIEITDKLFAWWVVTFRGHHVDTMVRAARLYRLTGDERYATWVAAQMDLYADNLSRWRTLPTARGARLFWQSLTEASNLVKFTEAVRLLGDHVDAARRRHWREAFFDPEVKLLRATHHDIHNIATWQRSAEAQVALLFGDEALWHDAIDGTWGLRRELADGITSDYLWYEQSLGYNNFVVQAVNTLFTTAGIYGRADELAPEMAEAENLMLAPTYLRFPNGQLPNPADSGGIPTAPNRELFLATYRVFPTTVGLTAAARVREWDTLLDPPPPAPASVVLPPVTSRNLESTRMAVLKAGAWQVFLHYGQLAHSHIQAEALNFSAFYGDTDITHDPGTVGYGSPMYRGYYTRGATHNVPLVNGEGEVPPQPGTLLRFDPAGVVSAAQPRYREGVRAERTLRIAGESLIDTTRIACTRGANALGLALHLQGKVRLPAGFAPDPEFAAHRDPAFGYWRDVTSATFRDHVTLDVAYGRLLLRVTITAPGEFRLWHASTPDVPPHRRDSLYLELTAPATEAVFTTTFAPATGAAAP